MSDNHPCHASEIGKLNRISGQVEGIKKMIGEGRYCPDILTQLRAVRSALRTVEANVLETHLHHCVADAIKSDDDKAKNEKIAELKALFKRYEDA